VVTQAELDQCASLEAQRYLSASYAELVELAHLPANDLSGWRSCGGEGVYLDVVLAAWGLRKRVSVELTLSAGDKSRSIVSIVYFEKFRSGKMRGPWPPVPPPSQ
jgi:hypothetical protein